MEPFPMHDLAQDVHGYIPGYYTQLPFPQQYQKPTTPGILKYANGILKHQKQQPVKTLRFNVDPVGTTPASDAARIEVKSATVEKIGAVSGSLLNTSTDDASQNVRETTLTIPFQAEESASSGRQSLSSEASSVTKPSTSSLTDKSSEVSRHGSGRTSSSSRAVVRKSGRPFLHDRGVNNWAMGRIREERKDYFGKGILYGGDGIASMGSRSDGSEWDLAGNIRAAWRYWYPRYALMTLLVGLLLLAAVAVTTILSQNMLRNDSDPKLVGDITMMPGPMAEDEAVIKEIHEPLEGGAGGGRLGNPEESSGDHDSEEREPFEENEELSHHRVTREIEETPEAQHTLGDVQEIVGNLRRSQRLVAQFPLHEMVRDFSTSSPNARVLGINVTAKTRKRLAGKQHHRSWTSSSTASYLATKYSEHAEERRALTSGY